MELIADNVSVLAAKLGTEADIITKFLTDATATEEVKPFAEKLGTLQVFPEDIFNTRLANERQTAATEAANLTLGKTYGAVDKRVKDATGIEKQSGESTLDYQERAFREKFSKTTDSEELQRLRDDAAAAKTLLAAKTTEFDNYKTDVQKKLDNNNIVGAFTKAASKLDLVDPAQASYLQFMFDQKYSTKLNGEVLEYTDRATNQVVRDPATAGPMGIEALLQQFAPTVPGVSFKKPSAKTGSGFESSSITTTTEGSLTMDFATLTSYDDFKKALAKAGHAAGSDEAGKLYAGLKKARPDLIPK